VKPPELRPKLGNSRPLQSPRERRPDGRPEARRLRTACLNRSGQHRQARRCRSARTSPPSSTPSRRPQGFQSLMGLHLQTRSARPNGFDALRPFPPARKPPADQLAWRGRRQRGSPGCEAFLPADHDAGPDQEEEEGPRRRRFSRAGIPRDVADPARSTSRNIQDLIPQAQPRIRA